MRGPYGRRVPDPFGLNHLRPGTDVPADVDQLVVPVYYRVLVTG